MNQNRVGKDLNVLSESKRVRTNSPSETTNSDVVSQISGSKKWKTQNRSRWEVEDSEVNIQNPLIKSSSNTAVARSGRAENSQPPLPNPRDAHRQLPRTRSTARNSISTAVNGLEPGGLINDGDNTNPNGRSVGTEETRGSPYDKSDTAISFNPGRFIRTFLYHALYPISLPFLARMEGKAYLHSMSFLSPAPMDIINSHVFPLMLLFSNIVVASGLASSSKGGPTGFEIAMVDLYYLFRILVIGIKYATLSDKLYKEMGQKRPEEGREINAQNMLVTGWMNPQKPYVEEEISSEEKRRGFDLKRAFFKVDSRLHSYFDKIFREGEENESNTSTALQKTAMSAVCTGKSGGAERLAENDVEESHHFGDASARRITLALWLQNIWPLNAGIAIIIQVALTGIFRVVTPLVVAADFNRLSKLGDSSLDLIPRIFIMIVGSHLQFSLLTFLMIAILDYYRRHTISSALTALSRNTRVMFFKGGLNDEVKARYENGYLELEVPSANVEHPEHTLLPPVLDLSVAENAFSWYRLRLVLRHAGRRFSLRLQTYVTVMLIILLGMDIIFLVRFLSLGQEEFMGDFQSVLLLAEVIYMNAMVLSFFTLMIIHGSLANSEMEAQAEIFVKALVKLEELRREYPEDSTMYRELNSTLQALRTVRDVVQIDDVHAPVRILGIRASPLLLRAMAAGLLTVISAMVGRLFMEN